jgi:hypothetical protein
VRKPKASDARFTSDGSDFVVDKAPKPKKDAKGPGVWAKRRAGTVKR